MPTLIGVNHCQDGWKYTALLTLGVVLALVTHFVRVWRLWRRSAARQFA